MSRRKLTAGERGDRRFAILAASPAVLTIGALPGSW